MVEPPDPYAVLNIPAGASPDEITCAYRRAARRLHPDVTNDPDAAERFAALTTTYQRLRGTTRKTSATAIAVRRRPQPPLVAGPVHVSKRRKDADG